MGTAAEAQRYRVEDHTYDAHILRPFARLFFRIYSYICVAFHGPIGDLGTP